MVKKSAITRYSEGECAAKSEIELLNPGTTLVSLSARPKPRADGEAGGTWRDGNGDGLRAAYFARAVSGCPEFNGEHRRLPCNAEAAHEFGRFFTGQITSACAPPAK